ncbi:MAG TPA: hypothetical protein VJ761_15820 [Ktedonobacteraceae bacterium]|nr:hypothetical protein [Ktedonobacteraceae bacterium]
MQTLANRSPNSIRSQTRTIAFFAVLLFALSGLISGFAVGAFIHPKTAPTTGLSGSNTNAPVTQKSQTPDSKTTTQATKLGYPVIDTPVYFQKADGSTLYTFTAHAVDQAKDAGHGNPVHAAGITCKLWLTKDGNVSSNIPAARLRSVGTLQEPFPKELPKALVFTSGTSQIQSSNANGQATWKYTLSTSLHSGTYYLVVLMDWNGTHYNWSWITITVKQED